MKSVATTRGTKTPLIWGLFGMFGMGVVLYLVQAAGMRDWAEPMYFFQDKWYFLLPLVVGFGVQVGLYCAIHVAIRKGTGVIVASGGVSTGSMVACCLHNFAPLLPIIGVSGAVTFFSVYQDYVFSASLLFVLGGVWYMAAKYRLVMKQTKV